MHTTSQDCTQGMRFYSPQENARHIENILSEEGWESELKFWFRFTVSSQRSWLLMSDVLQTVCNA
eukprot:m.327785 g.327785  ORF g.327785 m.327785 type:complete len:65 (+) comp20421_c0_seq1:978-1172(+)